MTPSWRKPVGMLAVLAGITLWCVGIGSLSPWLAGLPQLAQLVFYAVAGVAWLWVLPFRRILFWMEHGRWR